MNNKSYEYNKLKLINIIKNQNNINKQKKNF